MSIVAVQFYSQMIPDFSFIFSQASTPHQSSYKSISQFSSTVQAKVSIKSLNISLRMTACVNVGLRITLAHLQNSWYQASISNRFRDNCI